MHFHRHHCLISTCRGAALPDLAKPKIKAAPARWTAQAAAALMSPDPSGRATPAPRASRTALRGTKVQGLQSWAPDSRACARCGRTPSSWGSGPLFGGVRMERLRGLPCREPGSGSRELCSAKHQEAFIQAIFRLFCAVILRSTFHSQGRA